MKTELQEARLEPVTVIDILQSPPPQTASQNFIVYFKKNIFVVKILSTPSVEKRRNMSEGW